MKIINFENVKKIKNIIIENNFSNDVFLRTIMDKCLEN
jgi:hypothetical protein